MEPITTFDEADVEFDDNGWVIFLESVDALEEVLKLDLGTEDPKSLAPDKKLGAIFWGIVDLKYDPRLPILERVKVLETGDGRNSKFSNHGSTIPIRFRARHKFQEGASLGRFTLVSNNKRLTHDEMFMAGYNHLMPKQLVLPREYKRGLAQEIIDGLWCSENDVLVLKLLNRSRAAGIIPVTVAELDEVLQELLQIPEDMEEWFLRKVPKGNAETIDIQWGSFEEQYRHWWSNECPFFAVEPCCSSFPVESEVDNKLYDPTMRVSFVLRRGTSPQSPISCDPQINRIANFVQLPSFHNWCCMVGKNLSQPLTSILHYTRTFHRPYNVKSENAKKTLVG